MRIFFMVAIVTLLNSCESSNNNKIPTKDDRESTTKDIIGIWELFKQNYDPIREPSLVNASDKKT